MNSQAFERTRAAFLDGGGLGAAIEAVPRVRAALCQRDRGERDPSIIEASA